MMGATGWQFFVPYQDDMTKVLADLHSDVFARGDYERPAFSLELLHEYEFFEADAAEQDRFLTRNGLNALRPIITKVGVAGLEERLEQIASVPRLTSRQDLEALMCLTISGTSSILDISRVTAAPHYGALFPLSQDLLLQHFGTTQPTRDMVEAWQLEACHFERLYKRQQGIYIVFYNDGRTDGIYIEGRSGD